MALGRKKDEIPTQFEIDVPKGISEQDRQAIAAELIDVIIERTTRKNVDWEGEKFPSYTDEYRASLNYKIAKGRRKKVDLTLSGEMLESIELIENFPGKIVIGYPKGSENEGKAEGNIIGSYGRSAKRSRARDFLGASDEEIRKVLDNYPVDDREARIERRNRIAAASIISERIAQNVGLIVDDEDEE